MAGAARWFIILAEDVREQWMSAKAERAARVRSSTGRASGVSNGSHRTPSSRVPRHNLPAALSSFVGREREAAEVGRLLGESRLLTLTGTGGSGKTRLALKVAGERVDDYPDGVWLVELASLSEETLVAQAVARVLDVQEQPGHPFIDTLVESLGAKELLLILDNSEHLTEACARLVEEMLRSCPRLRVLVTSREPLSVPGETTWRIPFLSTPGEAHRSVEELHRYEAVRLFEERAKSRLPEFELTHDNARSVAGICRRLEGIPLAIELAAARMSLLSVEEISERLADSLGLLSCGARTAEPRQRTLRAMLQWSHDLLDERERTLFRFLSVFTGSWTLQTAEDVVSRGGFERTRVLDLLGSLVDKSVVIVEAGGDGSVRCRMLEPVRQFAAEKLREAGEEEDLGRAHRDWCTALAREAERELIGAEQGKWMELLEAERGDLRRAIAFSLEVKETEEALTLGGALWLFWYTRGHYSEGRRWLERALEAAGESSRGRAKALNGLGNLIREQGDYERAEALHERACVLYRERGNEAGVAWSLGFLGLVARYRCEYERAASLYERSLKIFRTLEETRGAAFALFWLGVIERMRGDHAKAAAALEESLDLFRESEEIWGVAAVLTHLGGVKRALGDYDEAGSLIEEGLCIARELGDRKMASVALEEFGLMTGDLERYDRAVSFFRESLTLTHELDDKRGVAGCLETLAGTIRSPERTVRLFGAARTLRDEIGAPLSPAEHAEYEARLNAARQTLGDAAFEEAYSGGRAMSREEAVEEALSEEALSEEKPVAVASSVPKRRPVSGSLTPRELDVLRLIARGKTNREIADILLFSVGTAKIHVRHILAKFGVSGRTRAAVRAHELGLLDE